jgi:hypothetical protein
MRKVYFVVVLLTIALKLSAFEGNIQLTRQSQYDTTYLVFYFKETRVRIDEFTESGQLNKTLLMDTETGKIIALSPSLKLYTDITRKETKPGTAHQFEVLKSDNFKYIDGKKCYQWRVRNRILESEITYWVMESNNQMMQKLYSILNATENYSSIPSFYMYIQESHGYFPVLAVERNLVREEKQSIHITSIHEQKVPSKLFEIPKDYKNLKS